MKKRIVGAALLAELAVLVTASTAQATPPSPGVERSETIGRFEEDIEAKTIGTKDDPEWRARIDTKGATDVHFVKNTIEPGETLGWRSHPGPLIVVVQAVPAGEVPPAVALYRFDGSICTREEFTQREGWVEQGDSVATVRNEGTVTAVLEVAALTAKGRPVRIDVPEAPTGDGCPVLD